MVNIMWSLAFCQKKVHRNIKNQITLCYSKERELLRVETFAEYSVESWVDGTVTDIVAKSTIEYQGISANKLRSKSKIPMNWFANSMKVNFSS